MTHNLIAQAGRTTVERRFEFAALPHGWTAVIMLAIVISLCWAIVWMYRREGRRGASMTVRTALAVLRCLVILALACIWLEPVQATYIHRWIDSYCLVLVDDSSSMDLYDRYHRPEDAARVKAVLPGDQSFPVRRADIAISLLSRGDGQLLNGLARRNRVKVYGFSEAPKLLATLEARGASATDRQEADGKENDETENRTPDAAIRQLAARGAATNPSRALRRSIESLGGAPLAGVVLLSDGGFNQGDPVAVLARYIEDHRVPLHAIGIGDAAPPRNVRITEVVTPENAFKQDPFSVTAHIATQGMAGETIVVELYERDASESGGGVPVETRTVTIRADGNLEPLTFTRTREAIGRCTYRVSVPVGEYESVGDDNSKQTTVNVIDDRVRVLLIAGGPSWEYRYVSRLLTRDATFDLSCWLQSAAHEAVRDGNTIIDALPATPEELFEYDAVVMIDPDSAEFGPGWAKALETLVTDYGGGMLYVASRKFTPQFLRDSAVRSIVRMLPITPEPEADLILNRIGHYQTRSWPLTIAAQAFGHSILRLGGEVADARQRWAEVTGVYWHYPVLREKSVATVLMRHSDPRMRNSYGQHVLLATQFVGSGRSAFMAFDSTWRWRKEGEEIFDGFWVQMIRYLVEGKLLGAKKRATILTEGDTFQLGSAIKVTARLLNAHFEPLELDSVRTSYRIERRRQEFDLTRLLDRPGWYEGRFTPDRTGAYEIALTLPATAGSEEISVTHDVQVVRPNIEILDTRMNRAALVSLVERSPGGAYYEVDEMERLIDAIPDRHETTTIKSRPTQLWDRWWTLVALVGLLSVEWAVRKWVRLL